VPAAIVSDVTRLRQILVNLLSNAIKFTEMGEVVVTVSRDTEGGRVSAGDEEMAGGETQGEKPPPSTTRSRHSCRAFSVHTEIRIGRRPGPAVQAFSR
jgi:signal transduction histidine kinase